MSDKRITVKKITDKQGAFVREYVKDFNTAKAMVSAGYSKTYSTAQGKRMLENVWVKEEIEKYIKRKDTGVEKRREQIITKTDDMMHSDILDLYDVNHGELIVKDLREVPRGVRDMIQEITTINLPDGAGLGVKIRLIPRDRIIALNAKIHGMLIDRSEIKVDHRITLNDCLREMDGRQGEDYIEAETVQDGP